MPKDIAELQPRLPQRQTCGKCGAEFSWEPSDPARKVSPLVARCSKPSSKCDCGYGYAPDKKAAVKAMRTQRK
ncbi:MAG: hypothetical protein KDE14_16170 [Rhodobacteraceae bacterium]|nr:hypothetical protein [Paracoccaceae bacterium]